MLASMDSVLNGSSDPNMMDRAIRASASVTSNLDQMPLDNQVRENLLDGSGPWRSFVVGEGRRYHRDSRRENQRDGISR